MLVDRFVIAVDQVSLALNIRNQRGSARSDIIGIDLETNRKKL